MKYTLQHCCDKTMDDRMVAALRMLFFYLYKIMADKVSLVGFPPLALHEFQTLRFTPGLDRGVT